MQRRERRPPTPGVPLREVDIVVTTVTCTICDGQQYAANERADGMMDGLTRSIAGIAPEDPRFDSVVGVLRGHAAGILAINPGRAATRLNPRAEAHLANGRLRIGTPIWFVATRTGDVTAHSGEVFHAVSLGGQVIALEAVTIDAMPASGPFIAGGVFDGYLELSTGRPTPVLRGGFRIGQ